MMKSKVNDVIRESQLEYQAGRTEGERLEDALQSGRQIVADYAATNGLSFDEARRALELTVQKGRRHSRCVMDLLNGSDSSSR